MSVVKIVITAPALREMKGFNVSGHYYPGYKVGDQIEWGKLSIDDLLKAEGAWKFWPDGHTRSSDDFWGFHESRLRPNPVHYDYFDSYAAEGHWENQHNVNLLLRAEKPKPRLAMTLYQFTPRVIQVGSHGSGTLIRGNTKLTIKANPVIGPMDQNILDPTDGQSLPIRWRVSDITSPLGYTRYQRLADY